MHDFERDEFVVGWVGGRDEEEGGVAAVDYFCICNGEGVLVEEGVRLEVGGGQMKLRVWAQVGRWVTSWPLTFVFEEVAHPRPTRQHQLRDVFDDFGLLSG